MDDFVAIFEDARCVAEIQTAKADAFTLMKASNSRNCLLLYPTQKKQRWLDSRSLKPGRQNRNMFLRDLLDAAQCYLVHDFDVGIRLKKAQRNEKNPTFDDDPSYKFAAKVKCATGKYKFAFCTKRCRMRG